MASTGNKPVNVNLDFSTGAKLKNLSSASTSGEAVEYGQFTSSLFFKQDLMSGGAGVDVTSNNISVDLATAGSGYDTLTVSGAAFASLDGTYTKLGIKGRVNSTGDQLDLTYGDLDHDWNMYEKNNGSGVYALIVARVDQNDYTVAHSWIAVLSNQSLSGYFYSGNGSGTIIPYVASYAAVDGETVATAADSDGNGNFSPDADDANIAYGAAGAAAGLKFSNSKLTVDWAENTGQAAVTKVFPSSVIKTYVDEQVIEAKDLSNHPFTNSTANLTGSPNNAQSAIEAAAAEIDTLDGQVSAIATVNATQDAYLADHNAVLGVASGADSLSAFTGAAAAFVGSSGTVQGSLQTVGDSISAVYQNLGTINGLAAFETDFGTGFTILPNNSDAKSLFQATEAELQSLSLGLGQFWAPVEAHSDTNINVSNPGTDTFGGAVVSMNDRVLLIGQTDASENGIWLFGTTGTTMIRATDADASNEFTPNKTVQVLNSTAEGISGATFAYGGAADPVIGTDNLTFTLKSQGVVGDNTITEGKLAAALAATLEAKSDKYAETLTFVAGTPQNVSHGLASTDVIVQVRDSGGNVVEVEIDVTDSSFVTINSPVASGDLRVIVIG